MSIQDEVIETTADDPAAIVCGTCGKAWLRDITPAGRCPWEADHPEEPSIMTRQDYMNASGEAFMAGEDTNPCFRAYYGQFVNERTINHVVRIVGSDRIMASKDRAMNDIPMTLFDRATAWLNSFVQGNIRDHGDYWTQAGLICVAKEAATQYKEAREAREAREAAGIES